MGLVATVLNLLTARNTAPPLPQYSSSFGIGGPVQGNYLQQARAYQSNEIVYAAIEMRASSASEPEMIGRRYRRESPVYSNCLNSRDMRIVARKEQLRLIYAGLSRHEIHKRMVQNGYWVETPDHPLVRLLNNPNPFMSRGQFWGTIVMDRDIAGNAYALKVRSNGGVLSGKPRELWRLRPDRVKVIPSKTNFIEGYEYNAGSDKIIYPAQDIIHFKTRNPINDYYGQSPLEPLLPRLRIDENMRAFLRSFYETGGSGPGAILTSKGRLTQEIRDMMRADYKRQFGGPAGAHELMILDNTETSYQQLGLNRGLRDALPKEIDAQTEARIAMVYGVPGALLGLLIGYETSSYANQRQAWQVFWDLTMAPLLSDLDDQTNLSFIGRPNDPMNQPEFGQIDEVCFDLSDIRALQEDIDKLRDRYRKDLLAGGISRERWQELTGEEQDTGETIYVPSVVVPTKLDQLGEAPDPADAATPPAPTMFEVRHPKCGKLLAREVQGNPLFWCMRCREEYRPHEEEGPMKKRITLLRENGDEGAIIGAEEEMVPV